MLHLHKILPVFLLPTGMTLLLMSLGLLLRKKVLCWTGLVVLWLASTALVGDMAMRAAEGWQVRVPIAALPSSQAIVVLSGMLVAPPGDASLREWSDEVDRFEAGIALFQAGKAPVLVFTGGWAPWYPGVRPEGEVLAERAALLGVPRRHMRRALTTFRAAGIKALPAPTDFEVIEREARTVLDWLPDAAALEGSTRAIREYLGLVVYQLRGWL